MKQLFVFSILAALCAAPAAARDYGQQGRHFPIIETDLLAQIHSRLLNMEKSGETRRLNQKLKAQTIKRVKRPRPVPGLIRAVKNTSRLFDPTITVASDILDHRGKKIWGRGAKVNPLDTVKLRQNLIFIDGDDAEQLEWALKTNPGAKLILTKGAPLGLMKAHQRRIYFDQGGTLIRHFAIGALPAMVDQQGRMLRIREFALPKKRAPRS